MGHSWAAYYQKIYEEEKKKNTLLAGKLAEAEAEREALWEKYGAVCGSRFYRLVGLMSLPKRACRKVLCGLKALFRDGRGTAETAEAVPEMPGTIPEAPEELAAAYGERLAGQRNLYWQWIRAEEPALWQQAEAFARSQVSRRRRCLVVPYGSLAGAAALSQVTEALCQEASCRGAAHPDILLFAEDPGDLDERAVSYIEDWFSAYPGARLFYGAEDHVSGEERSRPWFKPCFSPDTLLGFFYFGSYFAADRAWAEGISLAGYGEARQNLYDFVLRLLLPRFQREKDSGENRLAYLGEAAPCPPEIACTDLILYHRRETGPEELSPVPVGLEYVLRIGETGREANPEFWGYEEEYIALKQDFLRGMSVSSSPYRAPYPGVWSVVPALPERAGGKLLLSVVIPSKDHPELLRTCIGSFLERTLLSGLEEAVEFIVVDNGSSAENRRAVEGFLKSLRAECRYLYCPMPFNFSAMCNSGVREARGEFLLLLNDDMEVIEENWLRILLGQAALPGTGAAGAKLWYPEGGRIQHAGVTNMEGPSHKLGTFPDDRTYYYGHNTVTYDMIGVTAACLLVRRAIYWEVGGLDEELAVAFNDVDFCFKLMEAGYRNVLRNDAALLHHESASRGWDGASDEKWTRLMRERAKLIEKHPWADEKDPYYSRRLAINALEYRIGYQYPYERRLLTAAPERREGKEALAAHLSGAVMLTMERAGKQNKISLEEPDILEAEGWCYVLWQDNCMFERTLILEAQEGDFYYQVPVQERLRPDVEAILPQQRNIELAGFTCRLLREGLSPGSYRIGMLYRNLCSGELLYGRSAAAWTS